MKRVFLNINIRFMLFAESSMDAVRKEFYLRVIFLKADDSYDRCVER
jgi:hypothetical protein